MRTVHGLWLLGVVSLCGCPGESGGGTMGTTTAPTTSGDTLAGSSTDATLTGGMTGSASSSSAGATSTTGGESDSGDGTTGEPVVCGMSACPSGQICVVPCCGGPAPFCGPVRGESCPPGTHPVADCQFGEPCVQGQACCEGDPCVPEPAYCIGADAEEVVCMDDPNSPTLKCTAPCTGPLNGGLLSCEDCA
jgi:hypothetical protein